MKQRPSPEQEKIKRRRELLIALGATLIIGSIVLIESAIVKSAGDLPFSAHVALFALLGLVILLLIVIIFFLIRNFFKLIFERRGRLPGAHLKTRLTLAFVALTLVPTVLLFIASAGVLHTSIESWFKAQVEDSLQSALVVAQAFYQGASDKVLIAGARVAASISRQDLLDPSRREDLNHFLEISRTVDDVSSYQVYFADGSPPTLDKDPSLAGLSLQPPLPSFLKIGFQGEKTSKIVSLDGESDLVSGIAPIRDSATHQVTAVLVTDYFIPTSLSTKLLKVSKSFGDYQETRRMKEPVKIANILILLTVALLVILIGFWFGMSIARDITDPILNLAAGTEKIAAGALDIYIEPTGDDELASLVRSFNKMAEDLRKNRDRLMVLNANLESRRKYMEAVLKNIAAGVLSLDADGRITTMNLSAMKLLNISRDSPLDKYLSDVAAPETVQALEEALGRLNSDSDSVSKHLKINRADKSLSLLCFASPMKDDEGRAMGAVLVLEDMTHLVRAQRMAAWREVARRIAHEIKNPLTPIQLNAQRMRRKYMAVLGDDAEVLDQCTRAIVDQVEQLKNMVNEFSKFARMPTAHPVPGDVNALIADVINLYSQTHSCGTFTFHPDLSIPTLELDGEQIKRALVNLLDNAVAATGGCGEIAIRTSYDEGLAIATLEVADNGSGIATLDRDRLFEPYFTRKKGGTGLGLTIVSAIIADHNGFIRVRDNPDGGAVFVLEFPVKKRHTT